MGVVDGSPLSEVCQCLTALRSTEQHCVGSSGCSQGKLIKGNALSTSGDNALAGILGKRKCADAHLGALEHTNIISDLCNDDGDLSILVGHVLGKTVKANGGGVDLGHVQTLCNGGAESGVGTTSEELIKLDEKTVVGVLRLYNFHRRLVAGTAASCLKVDSHGWLVSIYLLTACFSKSEDEGGEGGWRGCSLRKLLAMIILIHQYNVYWRLRDLSNQ